MLSSYYHSSANVSRWCGVLRLMCVAFCNIFPCGKGERWAWTVLAGGVERTGGNGKDERPLREVSELTVLIKVSPARLLSYV